MRKRISRKGQEVLGMSFGTIFSIILIVFFIVISFIVINAFLKTQRCAQIGIFTNNFKEIIKTAFNAPSEESEYTANLPSNLEYVCFTNLSEPISASSGEDKKIADNIGIFSGEDANMVFYPREKACNIPYAKIDYLDIGRITGLKNLRCFKIKDEKINIQIKKGLSEKLVIIDG